MSAPIDPGAMTPSGMAPEPDDNLIHAHAAREEAQRKEIRRERILRQYQESQSQAQEASPQADAEDASAKPPAEPQGGGLGRFGPVTGEKSPGAMESAEKAGEVLHSLVPYPTQVVGGALDALQEIPAGIRDMSDWLGTKLGLPDDVGIVFGGDDDWISFETGDAYKDVALRNQIVDGIKEAVPDIDKREDGGGAMIRGITQFLTGFAATKRLPGMEKLAAAGQAGQFTAAAIRGAAADMTVFDPHEDRLSNLIESVPELSNPVTEYLAADPADTAAEGRFKNALEGLGLGLLTEGLFRGVRAIAKARAAKAMATEPLESAAREIEVLDETVAAQRQRFGELLGDPEKPMFDVTPANMSADEIVASGETGAARGPAAAARGAKGEKGAEFVINWSRIDEMDDVKAIMQDLANASKDEIDAVRGPKMRFVDVKAEASELNAFEVLKQRRELNGAALPPAESTALRAMYVTSGRKLQDLAIAVKSDPTSEINQIAFRKMLSIHNMIQAEALADQAAVARAFAARKIPVGDTLEFSNQMEELIHLQARDATTVDIADRIAMFGDMDRPDAMGAFAYGTPWAKTQDAVASLWYMSLLSGPHTHMRNLISNTSVLPLVTLERRVASFLSQNIGNREIPTGEAGAMVTGMFQGLRNAFRISHHGRKVLREAIEQPAFAGKAIAENADDFGTFYRSVATGESGLGTGKVDPRVMGAFDPDKWQMSRDSPIAAVMSMVDTSVSVPTRALTAGDEIFKSANFMMEIHAQATRKVLADVKAGRISPDDYIDEVTKIVNDPSQSMRLRAQNFAAENTFTNDPPRGSTVHGAMRAFARLPVIGRVGMAFVRTPYNIGRFTFRRTPIALGMQSYRDDILAGGARADMARAQMLTGTAILAVATDMALSGRITGNGPPSPQEKAHLRRSGWQPNSIVIGDDENGKPRYFSFRGLEPISASLGMAANTVEILAAASDEDDPEMDELVIATSLAIANQLTAANYMRGISDMVEAMSDPNRYGERYINRLSGAVIPTGVATVTRSMDPMIREVNDWQDVIRSRTPGLSDDLPAKHDLHGRPLTRESGLGTAYDILSPLYSSQWDPEPIDREMERLELYMSNPKREQRFDGVPIDLSRYPGAYQRFVKLAGDEITGGAPGMISLGQYISDGGTRLEELNSIADGTHSLSGWYDQLGREAQIGMIRSVMRVFEKEARNQILEEYPEIRSAVDHRLIEDSIEQYGTALDPDTMRAMR